MELKIGPNYRTFCQLLEEKLELRLCPDFNKLSELECRAFATTEFETFLEKGVHGYARGYLAQRNQMRDMYIGDANYEHESDPILDAYYTFAQALDIRPKPFNLETVDACRDETFMLFQQLMYHGARSFASTHYEAYPNDIGLVSSRSDYGPQTPDEQKAFEEHIKPFLGKFATGERNLALAREELYGRDEPQLSLMQRATKLLPWKK